MMSNIPHPEDFLYISFDSVDGASLKVPIN